MKRNTRRLASVFFALAILASPASAQEATTWLTTPRPPLRSWGTGFVVDHAGHLVTANHVTRDCAEIEVVRSNVHRRAVLEATDADNDLSLLRATPDIGAPVEFARDQGAMQGSLVLVADYLKAQDLVGAGAAAGRILFNGMVMAQPVTAGAAPGRLFIISDSQPGSSGSPVIDPEGLVDAMMVAKVSWRDGHAAPPGQPADIRLAISGSIAKDFLRRHNVAFTEAEQIPADRSSRTEDLLRESEVLVACRH